MNKKTVPTEPLVSVCIPTYNRAQKLKNVISHLFSCTYQNLEIIISDNASYDDTENVCLALKELDHRIRYYRHPENYGATENFKFARSQATGKYFLWHSDDDYLDPNYITRCVELLENENSLILVSGVAAYIRDNGSFARYGKIFSIEEKKPLERVIKYLFKVTENSIFCGLYRRLETMDCDMPNCLGGDWIWICKVLTYGKAQMLSDTYIYREYENSTSQTYSNIVRVIGAPAWHANYPSIALGKNISSSLSSWFIKKNNGNIIIYLWLNFAIFFIVTSRSMISLFRLYIIRLIRHLQIIVK